MSTPTKLNFKLYQGSTFSEIIRWESSTKKYVPITGITKAAPAVVTAVGHGIPQGWRFLITDVTGMKEINSSDTYRIATVKTVDSIELNDINSLSYTSYTTGGIITYNQPVDLTGYTARMQIRSSISSTTFLEELTSVNGKIILDNTNKTITLKLDAATTAAYTWTSGVYSLELVAADGTVSTLCNGTITVVQEITR